MYRNQAVPGRTFILLPVLVHVPRALSQRDARRRPARNRGHSWRPRCDFADAINRHVSASSRLSNQDLDKLAFKFEFAVNPDNAAALERFYVFDAIADTK